MHGNKSHTFEIENEHVIHIENFIFHSTTRLMNRDVK